MRGTAASPPPAPTSSRSPTTTCASIRRGCNRSRGPSPTTPTSTWSAAGSSPTGRPSRRRGCAQAGHAPLALVDYGGGAVPHRAGRAALPDRRERRHPAARPRAPARLLAAAAARRRRHRVHRGPRVPDAAARGRRRRRSTIRGSPRAPSVPRERLSKRYHRAWHKGHGRFYALMRDPLFERSRAGTVLGVPAHVYRSAVGEAWAWAVEPAAAARPSRGVRARAQAALPDGVRGRADLPAHVTPCTATADRHRRHPVLQPGAVPARGGGERAGADRRRWRRCLVVDDGSTDDTAAVAARLGVAAAAPAQRRCVGGAQCRPGRDSQRPRRLPRRRRRAAARCHRRRGRGVRGAAGCGGRRRPLPADRRGRAASCRRDTTTSTPATSIGSGCGATSSGRRARRSSSGTRSTPSAGSRADLGPAADYAVYLRLARTDRVVFLPRDAGPLPAARRQHVARPGADAAGDDRRPASRAARGAGLGPGRRPRRARRLAAVVRRADPRGRAPPTGAPDASGRARRARRSTLLRHCPALVLRRAAGKSRRALGWRTTP